MKAFDNAFLDIALSFSDSLFNSFLFKPVFFTKLATKHLLAKFACFSLAVRFSDVTFLSSYIFIMILISRNFISNFTNVCYSQLF